MRTTIKANKYPLSPESEAILEEKLAAPLRLLGEEGDGALLEIEIEEAPARGARPNRCGSWRTSSSAGKSSILKQ